MTVQFNISAVAAALLAISVTTASAADFTIRASHAESTDSPLHKGWQVFEAYVESASGGAIDVEIAPAGQLGSMTDALEQVKVGAIQMGHGDEQVMSTFYKPMMILATPYLFNNDQEGMDFVDSPFFTGVRDTMAKESGIRLVAAASYGFRNFTNKVRPIKSAADMAGIRMRVPPSPMSLEMVKAMGGSPTPVPWEELYGAMQSGVVDGQENPVGVALDYSFYQVQKYMTLDNHQLGLNTFMINEAFFQSLTPELRTIVITGARMGAATEFGERNYQARVTAVDKLRELGMEIYSPTPEEAATFRDAVREPMQAYLKTELEPSFVESVYAEIEAGRRAAEAQ